jgi:hypothetical protein
MSDEGIQAIVRDDVGSLAEYQATLALKEETATSAAASQTARTGAEAARDAAVEAAAQAEENVVAGVAATGQRFFTTTNPQKLLDADPARKMWRVYNLSLETVAYLGYSNVAADAGIPLAIDGRPLPGHASDIPAETNEIWYHGRVGSELSVPRG